MHRTSLLRSVRLSALIVVAIGTTDLAYAQRQPLPPRIVSRDSVTIAASTRYEAGAFKRFFLGNTYRDLWATPIRVPVQHIDSYAGGLEPLKEGGGFQTKNLRLGAPGGAEYVFRPVAKKLIPPERLQGTGIGKIMRDHVSALFPAAGVVIAPIADAAGVLHPTPQFSQMPNDSSLGKFRKDFADVLGTLEEYPNKPDDAPAFGGASEIADTGELLPLLDSLSSHFVDARAFLTARLTDMLVADADRHAGNWKWARFGTDNAARWVPIPRDRDHAFHHYDGLLARIASRGAPFLATFEGRYPSVAALSDNGRDLDRRFLAGLEKPVWDSVARALTGRVTDRVIDSAVARMPREYREKVGASFATKLKQRRDALPAVAGQVYSFLAEIVDVHGTNAADRAHVTYLPGGIVDVELRAGSDRPYYHRRFDPRETREVRVYLHDGDDSAVVTGDVASTVRVRIIGGNGTNELVDSSHVGRAPRARLYDRGRVSGYFYGPDSVRDTLLNRRPWVNDTGSLAVPSPDYGSRIKPVVGFGSGGLGLVPRVGVRWYGYGFQREPYATMLGLDAEYSTGVPGWRLTLLGDRRLERSRVHFTAMARMSDLQIMNFYGFGNDTDDLDKQFVRADQRQWTFRPAVAYALGRRESDVSFGPVIQYSATETNAGRLIDEERPYGVGHFGQAGARLGFKYDTRDNEQIPQRGLHVELNSTAFPAMWDVEHAFSQVSGVATNYLRLPLPLKPVLVLRAGGKKVWGDAPFHESAFLGGKDTLMFARPQRFAGDAALYGNSELRIPVASIRTFIPIDIGILGFADAGRVYVDGESPGGWHRVFGGGLWFGIIDPGKGVSIVLTDSNERRVVVGTGLRF